MPACARRDIVLEDEPGVYHCWSRCVRRAALCGHDPLSGKNLNHRRKWIREFQRRLAALMAVEVAFRSEMSNHVHAVLKARPDVVRKWSEREVARRYLSVNRLVRSPNGRLSRQPTKKDIDALVADRDRMAVALVRLSNISRFMGALCEHVARRANAEDECTGRFWEGRFKCRRLEDDAAILTCGIYVDLNQIRAGEASTPEGSKHTSAYDRIQGRRQRAQLADAPSKLPEDLADGWMCELTLRDGTALKTEKPFRGAPTRRATDTGVLPITGDDYLQLLDRIGRQMKQGKGAIPNDLAPILDRLGIKSPAWIEAVANYDRWFGHVVGRAEKVAQSAKQVGRHWYQGVNKCREAFG